MFNVVLYLRYSSDKQTEQSIDGQRHICEDFCRRNDYQIVGEYIDRALSASKETDKRREFNRMIGDSAKGKWQAVVVYKLDRFARNRYDSATFKARLRKNGVKVISATEQISDSPEGIILESVLEGMAEFYSAELSQKVTRGMNETAMKGNNCGGITPLGYKVNKATKKLEVYEPDAQIVREAFAMYIENTPIDTIVKTFNAKGYKTAMGKQFNKCSFATMFRNEKYIGVYTYNGIRLEDAVPRIINQETWSRAQVIRQAHKHAPGANKAKVNYLLSQKLVCGHCGSRMVGAYGKSSTNGQKYYYYVCPNARKHTCVKTPVSKEGIEDKVAEHLAHRLTPEFIDQLAEMAVKANRDEINSDALIPALISEIEESEKKITNLVKVIESGVESKAISDRIKELEREKIDLIARLDEAQAQYIVIEKVHVVWWLSKFVDGDLNDDKYKRSLFDLLLNSVTIWNDPDGYRLVINYNLTDRPTEMQIVSGDLDFNELGSPSRTNLNWLQFATVWVEKILA